MAFNLTQIADELKKKLQQGVQLGTNAWNGYVQNVAKPAANLVPNAIKSTANYFNPVDQNKYVDAFFNKASNLPRFQLPQTFLPTNTPNPVVNVGRSLVRGAIESPLNIPRNLIVGNARLQQEQLNLLRGKGYKLGNAVAGAGNLVEAGLDLSTVGIGKAVGTQAAENVFKQGVLNTMKRGTIQGALAGAVGGGAYGVGNQYNKKFNVGEVAMNTAGGALLGGILGGTVAGLGTIKRETTYSPKQIEQLRNAMGQWIKGDAPVKPNLMPKKQWEFQIKFNEKYNRNPYTPVMQSDLRAAIKYEAEQRVGMTVRDINKPAIPGSSIPIKAGGIDLAQEAKKYGSAEEFRIATENNTPIRQRLSYMPIGKDRLNLPYNDLRNIENKMVHAGLNPDKLPKQIKVYHMVEPGQTKLKPFDIVSTSPSKDAFFDVVDNKNRKIISEIVNTDQLSVDVSGLKGEKSLVYQPKGYKGLTELYNTSVGGQAGRTTTELAGSNNYPSANLGTDSNVPQPPSIPTKGVVTPEELARQKFNKSWQEKYGNRPATVKTETALDQQNASRGLQQEKSAYIQSKVGELKSYSQKDIDAYNQQVKTATEEFEKSKPLSIPTKGGVIPTIPNKPNQVLSPQLGGLPEVRKPQTLPNTGEVSNISSNAKNIISGISEKPKKLVERMSVSEKYAPELRQMLDGTYIPKSNVETITNAKRLVRIDATAAEVRAMNPQNAVDQAIGAELFNHYMDQGNVGRANAVLNATSGTNEGQMIQILSQYDKTSPQGAVKFAKSMISTYNEAHPNKPLSLDDKTVTEIYKQAKEIQGMAEGRNRNLASQQLIDRVNALVPSTLVDKAITVWKAGLLTSLRTHERNLIGNSVMSASEMVKDLPAAFVDTMLSWKTGKRSLTPTLKGVVSGGKEGVKVASDVIKLGFDPQEAITKFDVKKITWGDNVPEQILKKYTDVVFRTLGAEDKVFWGSSYARSLYDQAGTEAINAGKSGNRTFIENLVKNPSEIMKKNATIDSNYATFHDQTMLSNAASSIKKALSKNELTKLGGELVMPFTGVPSSIAGKIIDYSPIGLAKGIFESGKVLVKDIPTLQRQAVQDVGRGVVGSALFALGAYLASKGLMTGQPKDAAEARQWQLENKPYNSIFLNGKWRGIGSIGPQPLIMLAGAKAQEDLKQGGGGVGKFAGDIGKDFTSQTFLAGVQGPLNAISDPARYGGTYLKSQAGSIVPNIIADTSKSIDPNQRETNTPLEAIKARIPLLRNQLLPKRDALGNIMPQEPTGAGAFVDVFNSKTPVSNPVVDELSRLNSVGNNATPGMMTKSQTIKGVKQTLTPEQLNNLEAQVGPEVTKQLQLLINSSGYQKLGDEEKSNAIGSIITAVRKKVRANADISQAPDNQSGLVSIVNAADNTQTSSGLGQFILVDPETGSVKNIDLSTSIEQLPATGNTTIDKLSLSAYKADIKARIKDLDKLRIDGQITLEQEIAEVDKLQSQYDKTAKAKKSKKITFKVTKYKSPKITLKKKSALKMPTIKFKKPKIKKTTIRRYSIK